MPPAAAPTGGTSLAIASQNLECGTDASTRLQAGKSIMGLTVEPAKAGDTNLTIAVKGSQVQITAKPEVFFAVKVFGEGAKITDIPPKSPLAFSESCSSQVFNKRAEEDSLEQLLRRVKVTELMDAQATTTGSSSAAPRPAGRPSSYRRIFPTDFFLPFV